MELRKVRLEGLKKRRVSIVKGIVIARRNARLNTTFSLRRLVAGVGVENLFHLKNIDNNGEEDDFYRNICDFVSKLIGERTGENHWEDDNSYYTVHSVTISPTTRPDIPVRNPVPPPTTYFPESDPKTNPSHCRTIDPSPSPTNKTYWNPSQTSTDSHNPSPSSTHRQTLTPPPPDTHKPSPTSTHPTTDSVTQPSPETQSAQIPSAQPN
ncbi:hypothetical protein RND71_019201 [Anisodus tanguticus]|uniref:Uncharacterized protein n=1 Tax=Anisodus tanguticus TaxID=243964 RepID=A0AAE1VG88_9SOLA|nr:hypothetical protein RND71_019201 [Anisodus tanguticus]